jgi:hypothetical protein
MTRYKVGYFVGSLATASINHLLSKALVRLAPAELEMTEIPFKDLPLYSYDYDADYPPVAVELKNAIAAADAVLFVTPETTGRFLVRSRMRSTGPAGPTERTRSRENHRRLSGPHPARSARR